MISEGRILIEIRPDGAVRLESNRVANVANLLVSRTAQEAIKLLPLVFSLCAHAHVMAAKGALNLPVSEQDRQLVLAENAREHLLRILMGWKVDNAPPLPPAPVMSLLSEVEKGTAIATLKTYLQVHIFGLSLDEFLKFSAQDIKQWLAQSTTLPALYLAQLANKNWQSLGAAPLRFLPQMPIKILRERLDEPDFALMPDWNGKPCETGSLARQSTHPIVLKALEEFGAGLFTRHLARLVELAQTPKQMATPQTSQKGVQKGVVETARGRLVHVAKVTDNKITKYAILAPTEWNFHPKGIAMQSLSALRALDKSTLAMQARAVVEAIDPCVDFDVRVA